MTKRNDPNIPIEKEIPTGGFYPYDEIHYERVSAHKKHGAAGNSREEAHWEDNEWLPILVEEVGEVAHLLTYDTVKTPMTLRKELIQVAAMAVAWIVAIDDGLANE